MASRRPSFLARLNYGNPSSLILHKTTDTASSLNVPPDFSNPLIAFYSGASDFQGRTLDRILKYSDTKLEEDHSYIQLLFPLPERSPFNPYAPVIDEATAHAFRARRELKDRLRLSFMRMVAFYGFRVEGVGSSEENDDGADCAETKKEGKADGEEAGEAGTEEPRPNKPRVEKSLSVILDSEHFRRNCQHWFRPFDHNHLRITRIIRSLRVLGLEKEARSFYDVLQRAVNENTSPYRVPGKRSLMYWKRAAFRPLEIAPEDDE